MQSAAQILTPRWTDMFYHAEQQRYFKSEKRFNIAHSGRRGGKTEIAKRRQIIRAMNFEKPQGRFVFGAPTHRQAVDIFWDDVVAMVPRWALFNGLKSISLSYRRIKLYNGAYIEILGLDKPERIEGPPLDGFVGDEFGNFKPGVWEKNIRPALSTLGRPGRSDLIGVPEGRNFYFQLAEDAVDDDEWDVFTWHTDEINPDEAEKARGSLASLVYSQEYGGEFISFKGRCYYAFDKDINCPPDDERIIYNANYPLDFSWDFNRIPGNCVISQELPAPDWLIKHNQGKNRGLITSVIDEVFLQQDSNTEKICDILLKDWNHHKGIVRLFGDATGGAKVSSAVDGSDWDIINAKLDGPFNIDCCYPRSNPLVRVRINTVNSRLCATDGYIGAIIDKKCKFLIRDFESVSCDDEGNIQKSDIKSLLTHVSDAFGYLQCEEHPLAGDVAFSNTEW